MTTYKLYLESGPRKKRTMVHVLDLLGCIAKGSTTEEALDNTPGAIRAYLRFLKLDWMSQVRKVEISRILSLSEEERARTVEHWKRTWTARKVLRRMLEHEWEHLVELNDYFAVSLV